MCVLNGTRFKIKTGIVDEVDTPILLLPVNAINGLENCIYRFVLEGSLMFFKFRTDQSPFIILSREQE